MPKFKLIPSPFVRGVFGRELLLRPENSLDKEQYLFETLRDSRPRSPGPPPAPEENECFFTKGAFESHQFKITHDFLGQVSPAKASFVLALPGATLMKLY